MTTTHKLNDELVKLDKDEPKKIELFSLWERKVDNKIQRATSRASDWGEVVLLEEDYFVNGDDLILCRNISTRGLVFRGRWNDGVV